MGWGQPVRVGCTRPVNSKGVSVVSKWYQRAKRATCGFAEAWQVKRLGVQKFPMVPPGKRR